MRIALVTGSSRGLGKAAALRLARDGAAVAVHYRERAAAAEGVVEAIRAAGGRAAAFQADLAAPGGPERLVRAVEDALGGVDILINNAGVLARGDLDDFDYSQMAGMRAVNVDGLVLTTRAAVGGMKARRWGRIVNLASIAALGTSLAGTTFYAATKAAVIALTRRFALELGPHGVTVNAVAPGYIPTDMTIARSPEELERITAAMAQKAMVRRVGAPADIAHAVAFLAGEDAGFITAQVLVVDGGRTDYISHV